MWGRLHESVAFQQYETNHLPQNMKLQQSGILISNVGFLGTSPDGVVLSESGERCGIIEIKCPYSCRKLSSVLDGAKS